MFMLERVSLVGILCSANSVTEEIRKLVETPCRGTCESGNMLMMYVRTG